VEVRAVGTAAIRRAKNREQLLSALRTRCGLQVSMLSGEEEARLAFLGAASRLESPAPGMLGVVDVGGGSSELVVGIAPDDVRWCVSLAVGGSATSLSLLAGPRLDSSSFERALTLLSGTPAAELAQRFGLEFDRVRLLPAGLLLLQAAADVLGCALQIGRGGLREGVLLSAELLAR
jgi:exopolyphosphatase/guanosine-5'-triphosphate,3'-diphosphate pyrophosphatase